MTAARSDGEREERRQKREDRIERDRETSSGQATLSLSLPSCFVVCACVQKCCIYSALYGTSPRALDLFVL